MSSRDIVSLLVALEQLESISASPASHSEAVSEEVVALAAELRQAVHGQGVRLPPSLVSADTASRIEEIRVTLSDPATSRRSLAWASLSTALASAEREARASWAAADMRSAHAVTEEADRLRGVADALATAARQCAGATRGPEGFETGARAAICGLGSRPDLNGERGTILSYSAAKGRYAVILASGGPPLLVRPSNLLSLRWGPMA